MSRLLHHRQIFSPFFVRNFWSEASQLAESSTAALTKKFGPSPQQDIHQAVKLPPLIPLSNSDCMLDFSIQVVDHDLWPAPSCSTHALPPSSSQGYSSLVEEYTDLDVIDDLRLHRKLFYKLDRGSKEFEEYNINFHHKKSLKKKKNKQREAAARAGVKEEMNKFEKPSRDLGKNKAKMVERPNRVLPSRDGIGKPSVEVKKVRMPTFNQLTDTYHLPFCLDIYITKGSVRACVVHRITSKVVAVAHSISKDMKFDLDSRKDTKACAAVGGVLAQRAIEDDIHNVVYTPRKGDKIEGKLQIVLQSIIDNGVDVKVKLKQRRHVKKTDC